MSEDVEIWLDIPGFPGRQASSFGRIIGPRGIMSGSKDRYGYVWAFIDGRRRSHHALVALAFIGPRPAGADIDHIDGDKRNNRPENLRYVDHAENMRQMMQRLGRVKKPKPPREPRMAMPRQRSPRLPRPAREALPRGARTPSRMTGATNGRARLTEEIAREILAIHTPGSGRRANPTGTNALAKRYGVSKVAISDLIHGRTWTHLHAERQTNG